MSATSRSSSTAASQPDPLLTNDDLLPTPPEERKWTWWHYSALWMGMVHNIYNFTWIGGLVALGMSVWQALSVALVGNLVQTVFIGINGRVGARFGLPFAVWARSTFGVYGANIAALARGAVAIGWFGIQSYLAATAINLLLETAVPGWRSLGHGSFLGMSPSLWITMVIYWLLNFVVLRHGMTTVRRFESWAGPLIFVVMLVLLIWITVKAGGAGTMLGARPAKYPTTSSFLAHAFGPAVSLYIAGSWATMVLNIPDLTRFARSNKQQFWGTMIGLPVASFVYFGMAAVIVSAVQSVYGKVYWNPTDILGAIGNPALSIVGAILLALATISVNIPSNVVAPAYDLTNLFARFINFRSAAYLSIIISFVYMPWKLMENPDTLYSVLNNIGVVLGPITGIMIGDFFFIRARRLNVAELFRSDGRYRYWAGFNPVSLTVLVLVLALQFTGEKVSAVNWAYEYAWPVGLGLGCAFYIAVAWMLRTGNGRIAAGLAPDGVEGNSEPVSSAAQPTAMTA